MGISVCVVGAGALGSAFAALLFDSGCEVTLLCRRSEQAKEINENGLTINIDSQTKVSMVRATADSREIPVADLIIILVKSRQTRGAIQSVLGVVGGKSSVLTIQNGLGNEEILAEVVGVDKVLSARTYVGSARNHLGQFGVTIQNRETVIGETDGRITPRLEKIARTFDDAGLMTVISNNIVGTIWDKLLVNLATGALSAITRLAYGDLYEIEEVQRSAFEIITEGINLADAAGISITERNVKAIWEHAGVDLPRDFKASMLQSVERRELTEIDFINGAIARLGVRFGIATPANNAMLAALKGIERSFS
ncbi:ketopantoate reductase family protein [Acidithrix sp. C25]|uniref:ketopantoate reductase family protein n=1 Tax=Acidithrix sp. C25 TaxID=1671482 RepID=UPI00191BA3D7|nr:ketopantoate reductase family protein [Acidithrix sp. C25]CAG4931372.1 unnamed protein product [Acidithrix sp. C25]